MSTSLMTQRRFAPLFWCQFFAAFGDNFLKTALVFVILFEISGANSGALITLAGATLIAPFFFLSGTRRRTRRSLRQSVGCAAHQVHRDGRGGHCRRRLRVSFAQPAVRRGLRVWHACFAVWPDQIRHPAQSAAAQGVAVRQRTDRSRHISCDPVRHDRRGLRRQWQQQSNPFRVADAGDGARELAFELADPQNRGRRSRSQNQPQHFRVHRRTHQTFACRSAAVVGRTRGELVLAGRCARPVALAAAGVVQYRRQRTGRDAVPDYFLGCRRCRLRSCGVACGRPHRAAADARRHRADRAVRSRSRLDGIRHCAGSKPAVDRGLFCLAPQHPSRD